MSTRGFKIRAILDIQHKTRNTRKETDVQEKEQKESQKQANPSTEWKGQRDENANLGNFIYKRKKGEKGNVKKKDMEGLFLYKSQTSP
ncbi:hypothetical protein Tco_0353985 [Tanacetum coccineum]